jgi:hypothetical protein
MSDKFCVAVTIFQDQHSQRRSHRHTRSSAVRLPTRNEELLPYSRMAQTISKDYRQVHAAT